MSITREEARSLLRRYRREAYRYNPKAVIFPRRNEYLETCVYGDYLICELIRKISASTADPIQIVSLMYMELDDILGDSDDDHFETHRFAARMEQECGNILRYLRTAERRKNEDAKD